MAVRQVNLRLDEKLLARVDAARGDVSRNVWIRRAVELRAVPLREVLERALPVEKTPTPVVERSPVPPVVSEPPREPSEVVKVSRPTDEQVAAITGHKPGCKCLKCDDARNGQ